MEMSEGEGYGSTGLLGISARLKSELTTVLACRSVLEKLNEQILTMLQIM